MVVHKQGFVDSKGKAADGKTDVYTMTAGNGEATMNVLGKIIYEGDWK